MTEDIGDEEILARFIVSSRWYRSDLTIKQDAFIPHPSGKLSVTRHSGISKNEIWDIGKEVATKRQATLHGRTDIKSGNCKKTGLDVILDEPPKNHVHIQNWPSEKSAIKMKALELAKFASKLVKTESDIK